MIQPEPEGKTVEDTVLGIEYIPLGPGRRYWGPRCQHDSSANGLYNHESCYRFYDADWQLLYVGITWSINSRWTKHRRKPWWAEVRHAEVTCFSGGGWARAEELRAISAENPVHNIARPKLAAGA